ncbi:MAG TPA: DUF4347 domain-containing protein [Chloroflexota bacterium]|nr:DUF4347 domain-containing protein [Chloroflexota bacterium]
MFSNDHFRSAAKERKARQNRKAFRNRLSCFDRLEERHLLSTLPVPAIAPPASAAHEVAFIESSVPDYQVLLRGLAPGVDAVVLDARGDGINQIAAYLAGRSGITAVDLAAHGAPGMISLGTATLDDRTLVDHASDLAAIRAALAPGADLILDSCQVASGALGDTFVHDLAKATAADVAASTGLVGSSALGGSWNKDVRTGSDLATSLFEPGALAAYPDVLDINLTCDPGLVLNIDINSILPGGPGNPYSYVAVLLPTVPGVSSGALARVNGLETDVWGTAAPNAFEPGAGKDRVYSGSTLQYFSSAGAGGTTVTIPIMFSSADGSSQQADNINIAIPSLASVVAKITQQPQSTTILTGQSATLSVTATGSAPRMYQWYQVNNGYPTVIPGANSSTYTTPTFDSPGQYDYSVGIESIVGTAGYVTGSDTATVTVAAVTTTTASDLTTTYSPSSTTLILSANVTSTSDVNTGNVTFTIPGVGTATSGVVTASVATAALTLPPGTAAGTYTIQAAYAGNTSFGASSANAALTINKAAQTIEGFTAPAKQTIGDTFNLSATSTSGLPVTYTSLTPWIESVSGNTVTVLGIGTGTIQASQAGDSNWNAAPSLTQSFTATVNHPPVLSPIANQSITFQPPVIESQLNLTLQATDADNDPITYSATVEPTPSAPAPLSLSLNGDVLSISRVPGYVGTFVVVAGASDGKATTYQSFNVTVTDLNTPTLAPIRDQAVSGFQPSLTVGLSPSGIPLGAGTFTAQAQTLPSWLEQTYGFYEDPGGYFLNMRGQQEKYLRAKVSANGYGTSTGAPWYYILPGGDLYELTPTYTGSALRGALVAHLGAAYYANPALLTGATFTSVPASFSFVGNSQLVATPPPGYNGTFVITVGYGDGVLSTSRSFRVTVTDRAPVLSPIANQNLFIKPPLGPASLPVALHATDPDSDPLTYSARALTLPAWLEQSYTFYRDGGSYHTGARGQQEKYLRAKVSANGYNTGTSAPWYYILPNGDLYELTPPYSNVLTGALVAHLGKAYYSDPTLLINAASQPAPLNVGVSGATLGLSPVTGTVGTFVVQVTVTDGELSATQHFSATVSDLNTPALSPVADQTVYAYPGVVIPNLAPSLAPISDQYSFPGIPVVVDLAGLGPDGDTLTYSAQAGDPQSQQALILGIVGNQLTITPEPGISGTFTVIATVSDGQASASQIFRVSFLFPGF